MRRPRDRRDSILEDLTVRQLQVFHAIVVTGSITLAAKRLGIRQPSVSQLLSRMEERIGSPLIDRNSDDLVLTNVGKYWFASCEAILRHVDGVAKGLAGVTGEQQLTLSIGVISTLRGRFAASAARMFADEIGAFGVQMIYRESGRALASMLKMREVDCVIVEAGSLGDEIGSVRTTDLFLDGVYWAVPAQVGIDDIRSAFKRDGAIDPHSPLLRYVELSSNATLVSILDAWYRNNLPRSRSILAAPDYSVAIDIVAAGMATTLCPLSLLPNLGEEVLTRIQFFPIVGLQRQIVIAMPGHLLNIKSYAKCFDLLAKLCRNDYAAKMDQFRSIPPSEPSCPRSTISRTQPSLD